MKTGFEVAWMACLADAAGGRVRGGGGGNVVRLSLFPLENHLLRDGEPLLRRGEIATGGDLTGGYSGLAGIRPLFGSRMAYYYFFIGLALASIVALHRFEFSRIGITCKAIAQSHVAAASVGINERLYRVLAVGVGSFFAGLIGAAYAHYNMVVSPSSFNLGATLWICMYVLIGGINSFEGPIIGTFILVMFPEFFRDLKIYAPYVSAIILIVIVYLMPQGLVGLPCLIKSRVKQRRKRRISVLQPEDFWR